jgi:Signal recognition particle GTPase
MLGEAAEIEEENPGDILLCGLFGAGKTTTAGKLADFYRKRGFKVGVVAADTDRPAAYEQLQQVAEDAGAQFYGRKDAENPEEVVSEAKENLDSDITIVDSAGRNSLDETLRDELSEIESAFDPDRKYLVMPADIGQSAKEQAEMFDSAVGINGVIVTKMDSSAKGGGALVACADSEASVKFVGTGEKMGDLETYDPVDFVSDMIGQPDLESLLDKIQELDTDPEELLEGEFTLYDFRSQMEQVTDAGIMDEMMSQLPFSQDQLPSNMADMTEGKIQRYSILMDSMTKEEMEDPSLISGERKTRIAEGSGTSKSEVGELLNHYRQAKNMMDKFDKGSMQRGNMKQMMSKLGL